MGKYYIRGDQRTLIVNRPNPKLAAYAFLDYYSGQGVLPPKFLHINETGNFDVVTTDEIFDVDILLGEKQI